MIDRQHDNRGHQQQHGCHGENNVQHLEIAPSLFGGRHEAWLAKDSSESTLEVQRNFWNADDVL